MMVGVLSGTYSSIFIATPVLIAWKEREPAYRRAAARIREQMGRVPAFPEDNEVARSSRRRTGRGAAVEPEVGCRRCAPRPRPAPAPVSDRPSGDGVGGRRRSGRSGEAARPSEMTERERRTAARGRAPGAEAPQAARKRKHGRHR